MVTCRHPCSWRFAHRDALLCCSLRQFESWSSEYLSLCLTCGFLTHGHYPLISTEPLAYSSHLMTCSFHRTSQALDLSSKQSVCPRAVSFHSHIYTPTRICLSLWLCVPCHYSIPRSSSVIAKRVLSSDEDGQLCSISQSALIHSASVCNEVFSLSISCQLTSLISNVLLKLTFKNAYFLSGHFNHTAPYKVSHTKGQADLAISSGHNKIFYRKLTLYLRLSVGRYLSWCFVS